MRRFVSVPRSVQGSMRPCPSRPLVDADRSLRIAGRLGQRRDRLSPHALREASVVAFEPGSRSQVNRWLRARIWVCRTGKSLATTG